MEGGELNVGAGGIITGNGTNPNEPYSCTLRGGTIRATADTAFRINATLNSTNAANNVAFDTAGHSLSVSNTLSGAGGLTKTGAGTMTIVPAATYTGTTRLAGGTLAFKQAYPGGALEVAAAAVQGTGTDGALLTAPSLTFTGTAKVRVTEAETLVPETYGKSKVVARLTTTLPAVPDLELVKSDGTTLADDGKWKLFLVEGGKALKFGPMRGTQFLLK
jgi:autotransporter-associated beta strand protein